MNQNMSDLPWEDPRQGIADDERYSTLSAIERRSITELAAAYPRWTSGDVAAELKRRGMSVTAGVVERVLGDTAIKKG